MIYQPTNIWGKGFVPESSTVGAFCDIAVPIGENCKIQTGVSIPPGWTIGDNVFIGPGARFANDKHHAVKANFEPLGGIVEDGACIGMGAMILPCRIGKGAIVGTGSVVTKDIPDYEVWAGNPARFLRIVDRT